MDYDKISEKIKSFAKENFDSETGKVLLVKSPKIVIGSVLGTAMFKGSIEAAKSGNAWSAAVGGIITTISYAYVVDGIGSVLDARPSVRAKIEAKQAETKEPESQVD